MNDIYYILLQIKMKLNQCKQITDSELFFPPVFPFFLFRYWPRRRRHRRIDAINYFEMHIGIFESVRK